jgi:hypothetical protein
VKGKGKPYTYKQQSQRSNQHHHNHRTELCYSRNQAIITEAHNTQEQAKNFCFVFHVTHSKSNAKYTFNKFLKWTNCSGNHVSRPETTGKLKF